MEAKSWQLDAVPRNTALPLFAVMAFLALSPAVRASEMTQKKAMMSIPTRTSCSALIEMVSFSLAVLPRW
jgi:hypothetical protein